MRIFYVLLLATSAFGQTFGVGVKGGVGLTDAFSSQSFTSLSGAISTASGSKDYVVGPMFEIRLPFSLAVEADALYRPLHFTATAAGSAQSGTISSWEIPIVGKYRFHTPFVKPYIEAGPSFRAFGNTGALLDEAFLNAPGQKLSQKGFTAGGGIDIKALVLHISPEIRFTHWGADSNVPTGGGPASNQNQAELLVGISF
jgi:hypothetical protein